MGDSPRTAERTVQQAYASIREDVDQSSVQRRDRVAEAIELLMQCVQLVMAKNSLALLVVL